MKKVKGIQEEESNWKLRIFHKYGYGLYQQGMLRYAADKFTFSAVIVTLYYYYYPRVHKFRAMVTSGDRGQNFVRWGLIFVGLHYETRLMSPFRHLKV